MKDCGVLWIGEIPCEWSLCNIASIAAKEKYAITDGPFGSDMKTDDYVDNGVPIIQLNNITPNQHKLNKIKFVSEEKAYHLKKHTIFPGEIVIAKMMPSGKAAIVQDAFEKYIISADCIRVKVNEENNARFICYSINALAAIEANISSFGATRSRINLGDAKKLKIVRPSLPEQQHIADFLDTKCREIDSVIEKTKVSLCEYKKLKQAIITRAVTKGIRENKKLVDSKIDWLGEIPSDWQICKIKHLLIKGKEGIKIGPFGSSLTNKVGGDDLGPYKIYGQWNIVRKDFSAGNNYVSEETYNDLSAYQIVPGDILISMMGTVGKCAIIPNGIQEGIMDSHVIKARLNTLKVDPEFFEYEYDKDCSQIILEQINRNKTGSIMDGLNSSIVKSLFFVLPPTVDEQREIVSFLNKKCSEIDSLIASKEKFITELESYKKSLIYEYVTGKKEVQ